MIQVRDVISHAQKKDGKKEEPASKHPRTDKPCYQKNGHKEHIKILMAS